MIMILYLVEQYHVFLLCRCPFDLHCRRWRCGSIYMQTLRVIDPKKGLFRHCDSFGLKTE
jgi:hypothetical protein